MNEGIVFYAPICYFCCKGLITYAASKNNLSDFCYCKEYLTPTSSPVVSGSGPSQTRECAWTPHKDGNGLGPLTKMGMCLDPSQRWLGPLTKNGNGLGPLTKMGMGSDPSQKWEWARTPHKHGNVLGPLTKMGMGSDPSQKWECAWTPHKDGSGPSQKMGMGSDPSQRWEPHC